MASVIVRAYVNCIKRGIRKIDDVRPDELKKEVSDILVAEGLFDLAGIAKEEDPSKDHGQTKEAKKTEAKEEAEDKEATDKKKDEPSPVEDKEA